MATDRRDYQMTKQEKMLEKVRALLAKADSTNYAAEADTFREAADKLMTQYAIESWMVAEGQEESRPKPERRDLDTSWYYRSAQRDDLWQLLHAVAKQTRCTLVWWNSSSSTPLIGLPADLDYAELLFTQLHLELVKRIEPRPEPGETMQEAAYRLRSSGTGWYRTAELLYNAELIDLTPAMRAKLMGADFRPEWRRLPKMIREQLKNSVATKVRKYRRENSLEDYTSVHPGVYARSFAQGFVAEIRKRFREMRQAQGREEAGDGNPFALALRDIAQVNKDEAINMFGEPPDSKALERSQAFSIDAYQNGASEARKVAIQNSPAQRVGGNRKELGR
jgi:hypothetical protein